MSTGLEAYQFNKGITPVIEYIGQPLMENFGITHFGLIKINNENLMLRIANHDKWNQIYTQEEFYNDLELYNMSSIPMNEVRKKLLMGDPSSKHEEILYEQNLWNFLLFYERTENEGSFFFFGADRNNTKVLEHYINHPDIFNHFIAYFKEKMSSFLEMKKENCIQLGINPLGKAENNLIEEKIRNFYSETEISKFNLGSDFRNAQLSKRELECLFHLVHGQTTKEIARTLNLSPRTVESFIKNIKIKTGILSKSMLAQKLFSVVARLGCVEK